MANRRRGRKVGTGLLSTAARFVGNVASTVVNRAIDVLPVELHIPGGYQYCGPGTNLRKRLERGDPGINELDRACRTHDIAYSKYSDSQNRAEADRVLAERAWQRVGAADASLAERAAAWAVTNIMKGKAKIGGGGGGKKRDGRKTGKGLYLRHYKGQGLVERRRRRQQQQRRKQQQQQQRRRRRQRQK